MPEKSQQQQKQEPALFAYRVATFCEKVGISRATFFKYAKRGEIRTVMIGGRRLVPASEVERLLAGGEIATNEKVA